MAASEDLRLGVIGGAVMVGLVAVIALVNLSAARQSARGYEVIARFNKAEGVMPGTDVRLAGVVVGKVTGQRLDDHFRAVLSLRLDPSVQLPLDSDAAIQSDSLLGGKFITLDPGGDDKMLKAGDEITHTADSLAVEDLLALIIEQAERAHRGTTN